MHVFVDESGDSGLKLGKGSTPFFTVALIVFDQLADMETTEAKIQSLRRTLGTHPNFEFKFNKCDQKTRIAFLSQIADCDFFYYGIVINKAGLYGPGFAYKGPFYKYVTQLVFLNAREHLDQAIVKIDGSGEREFRRQLALYIRKKLNTEKQKYIASVSFLDSQNSDLIQMADMVAGTLHRFYKGKDDGEKYLRVIRHRQAGLQVWPPINRKPKS
jgi:hypothetical protein